MARELRTSHPYLLRLGLPFGVAMAAGLASYAAAGASLGLFVAPILLVTIFGPPLVLAEDRISHQGMVSIGIVAAILLIWMFTGGSDASALFRCTIVLAMYLLALWGIGQALVTLKIPVVVASAIVVLLGLAWLTWPVWLTHLLPAARAESIVGWLAAAHPLLAINGVLQSRFDAWDRYPLAYQQLTTLNQDVLYRLPKSVIPAVLLHGCVGIAGLVLPRTIRIWSRNVR